MKCLGTAIAPFSFWLSLVVEGCREGKSVSQIDVRFLGEASHYGGYRSARRDCLGDAVAPTFPSLDLYEKRLKSDRPCMSKLFI